MHKEKKFLNGKKSNREDNETYLFAEEERMYLTDSETKNVSWILQKLIVFK